VLRYQRDWQSILYLLLQPTFVVWQWRFGFSWVLYGLMLFFSVGVCVVHHNHSHLKMWRSRWLNRVTDLWLTLLQGHPSFVLLVAHIGNHHRHNHGPLDAMRTYRFGGDTNHLFGYLLHPIQATFAIYPLIFEWLRQQRRRAPGLFRFCLIQYAIVATLWLVVLCLDWKKGLLFVIVPQLHGLHWLLASNYLQHAHADGNSAINFARNFEGWVNPLLFNIGLHTAHHLHQKVHWSKLPALHQQYRNTIAPVLNSRGLMPCMLRTFVMSLVIPGLRSRSIMNSNTIMDRSSPQ